MRKGSRENLDKTRFLIVLPAFVEHKPRRLLQAAARGVPVIASKSCGVENVEGIVNIETGDADILRKEIISAIESQKQRVFSYLSK